MIGLLIQEFGIHQTVASQVIIIAT